MSPIGYLVGQIGRKYYVFIGFWDSFRYLATDCLVNAHNLFLMNFMIFFGLWLESMAWREVLLVSACKAKCQFSCWFDLYRYLLCVYVAIWFDQWRPVGVFFSCSVWFCEVSGLVGNFDSPLIWQGLLAIAWRLLIWCWLYWFRFLGEDFADFNWWDE